MIKSLLWDVEKPTHWEGRDPQCRNLSMLKLMKLNTPKLMWSAGPSNVHVRNVCSNHSFVLCTDRDMAARHRARGHSIQIMKVNAIPASKCRRPHVKQFHVSSMFDYFFVHWGIFVWGFFLCKFWFHGKLLHSRARSLLVMLLSLFSELQEFFVFV